MKEKLIRFMQGRYGADKLNTHLLYISLILLLIGSLTGQRWLTLMWIPIIGWSYYRMFSKNISKRYQENQAYVRTLNGFKSKTKKFFQKIKDFPKYKYLKCSTCETTMRVPRRKGKIEVTCPRCHSKFDAKT